MSEWTDEAISEVFRAVEVVDYWFYNYKKSDNPMAQAHALISLASAMADLRSWHPRYDPDAMAIMPGTAGRGADAIARSKGLITESGQSGPEPDQNGRSTDA